MKIASPGELPYEMKGEPNQRMSDGEARQQTWRGEGAPKDNPASLARAMPVLAQGPRAGEGVAISTG